MKIDTYTFDFHSSNLYDQKKKWERVQLKAYSIAERPSEVEVLLIKLNNSEMLRLLGK